MTSLKNLSILPERNYMSENKEAQSLSRYVFVGFLAVLVVIAITAVGIPYFFDKPLEGPGEFGDMFGGVNAIFSELAFIGVIWAILLQKEELGLQRQELKDTRQELAGQLELQNSTFKRQAFDSVFLQMISLQAEIASHNRFSWQTFVHSDEYP